MVGIVFRMLALAVGATQFVAASPALITVAAPFPEESTMSAQILGVDAQGRTTYAVYEDEIDGSSTAAVITGTLVEGSDHAFFTMSHTSASETLILGFDCALSGGNAICSDVDSNSQPVTTTLAVQSIVLDVAETTAPPSTAASTGTTTAPGPTNKPSSAQKTSVSIFGVVVSLALAAHYLA